MSQSDFGVIDPNTKSGTQLAVDLNGFRDAVNSSHSGATRPAYLPAGGHWVRVVSSTRWDLVFYDGSVDYTLRSVNPTTGQGALSLPSGTTANRPASPAQFDSRGNSTTGAPEWWSGSAWVPFSGTDTLRIDVASATTVDLTSLAPNTRHINITGTTTITGFTIAAGQCYFVRFNATLTLTNGAALVTQTGANITTAAGDTCIIRATAANVVEVLDYTPSGGWANTLSANGYQKLPSGLIIQWGFGIFNNGATVLFPLAFPSLAAAIFLEHGPGARDPSSHSVGTKSLTGFVINHDLLSSAGYNWLAIGY